MDALPGQNEFDFVMRTNRPLQAERALSLVGELIATLRHEAVGTEMKVEIVRMGEGSFWTRIRAEFDKAPIATSAAAIAILMTVLQSGDGPFSEEVAKACLESATHECVFRNRSTELVIDRSKMPAFQRIATIENQVDSLDGAERERGIGPELILDASESTTSLVRNRQQRIARGEIQIEPSFDIAPLPLDAFLVWDGGEVYRFYNHHFDQMIAYEGRFQEGTIRDRSGLPHDVIFVGSDGVKIRVEVFGQSFPPLDKDVRVFAYRDWIQDTSAHGLRIPISLCAIMSD